MTERLSGMACPACGEPTATRAVFCSSCGYRLRGSRHKPPTAGAVVGAILLVLVALPFGLVGGGCTVMLLADGPNSLDAVPFMIISLGILSLGIGCCVGAGRLLAGRAE